MAYAQDTIISANASNALGTVLEGLLVDAGWTLVEALAPTGTNTPRTSVWLSDGGDNLAGYDWYITLMYKQVGTETQFRIIPHAAYNSGTNLASNIAAILRGRDSTWYYSNPITGDMFGTYDVNVATNTSVQVNVRGIQPIDQPWFSTIVPSSAFGYWASVTLDHFGLWTTIADGVTPNPGPANFFASTLDLDADWIAMNPTFGNGVVLNPIVMFSRAAACSGTIKGTTPDGSNPRIQADAKYAYPVGAKLPAISGGWFDAFAWRPAWYWNEVSTTGTITPAWTNDRPGDGVLIGQGFDHYAVYGGSIGDTVEIDGQVYVLSGPFGFGNDGTTQPNLAVLVEV